MNANIPAYLALALTLALPPAAAAGDLSRKFQALETRLLQARLDGDAKALGRLISPDFGYYQAFESRPLRGVDAESWQREVLPWRLESFEIHESHARRIGDQVVMSATRATLDGGGQQLLTSTWLEDGDGAWKLVAQVAVELGNGGAGLEAFRTALRDRSGGRRREPAAGAPAAGVDLEALRAAFRDRSAAPAGEARLKALRERWAAGQERREAPAGEAPATQPTD